MLLSIYFIIIITAALLSYIAIIIRYILSWNQAHLHLCWLDRVVVALPMVPVNTVSKSLMFPPDLILGESWSKRTKLKCKVKPTWGKVRWGLSYGKHCTTRPLWICKNQHYHHHHHHLHLHHLLAQLFFQASLSLSWVLNFVPFFGRDSPNSPTKGWFQLKANIPIKKCLNLNAKSFSILFIVFRGYKDCYDSGHPPSMLA